jgi:hypothetical protein
MERRAAAANLKDAMLLLLMDYGRQTMQEINAWG